MDFASIILILQLAVSMLTTPNLSPALQQKANDFAGQAITLATQVVGQYQKGVVQKNTFVSPSISVSTSSVVDSIIVSIASDKESVQNDGKDIATISIKVSSNDGKPIANESAKITIDGVVFYATSGAEGTILIATSPVINPGGLRDPLICNGTTITSGYLGDIGVKVEMAGGTYTKIIKIKDSRPVRSCSPDSAGITILSR